MAEATEEASYCIDFSFFFKRMKSLSPTQGCSTPPLILEPVPI